MGEFIVNPERLTFFPHFRMKKLLAALAALTSVSLALPVMAQVSSGTDAATSVDMTTSSYSSSVDVIDDTDTSMSASATFDTTDEVDTSGTDVSDTTLDDGMTGVGADVNGSVPSALPNTGGGGMSAHVSF